MANVISFDDAELFKTITQQALPGSVRSQPKVWLRLEGLLTLILSIFLYAQTGASWWLFGLLLLTPDLSMAGYWLNARAGATLYNLAHTYVAPVSLTIAALATAHRSWLPFALIWFAHISMDRAMGYGLKYPESFKMTHLGFPGRNSQSV